MDKGINRLGATGNRSNGVTPDLLGTADFLDVNGESAVGDWSNKNCVLKCVNV